MEVVAISLPTLTGRLLLDYRFRVAEGAVSTEGPLNDFIVAS